ncbi:glycosyltransferase [Cellulosimicrobium sp. TH-20]|uniref:glycosyltransferase n=1 Tax=Cellulosimicrobium sp. TH-20 TaxID=1980001 RepID=UPI0011A8D345|nr:glycosyltransferase [Cellulosimicrobium sp. TH-20]
MSAELDDYGRRVFAESGFAAQEARRLAAGPHDVPLERKMQSIPGISVVIPTYLGVKRIVHCVANLANQTLASDLFELVIVVNGPWDECGQEIDRAATIFPHLNIRWIRATRAGAGHARNLGVSLARHTHLTFFDDDDELEPDFLRSLWEMHLQDDHEVTVAPMIDIDEQGRRLPPSTIHTRTEALARQGVQPLAAASWLLGFNACKLVPLGLLRGMQFHDELRSGEDVAFWSGLLEKEGVRTAAVQHSSNAYRRTVRTGSVSRQRDSFDFSVAQRLDVIAKLEKLQVPDDARSIRARATLIEAQANFVGEYVKTRPAKYAEVRDAIQARGLLEFPWRFINAGRADCIAFLYCFAPFSDTSGIVAARRLVERDLLSDVISNDMTGVRRRDGDAAALAGAWIDESHLVDAAPSFAGWAPISEYARKAVARAESLRAAKNHRRIYSRAMWVGSHLAALLMKSRHPDMHWIAEFSDPMSFDAEGVARPGTLESNDVLREIDEALRAQGHTVDHDLGLFGYIEAATVLLADELVFTNEEQYGVVRDGLRRPSWARTAGEKKSVSPHPVPPAFAYELRAPSYDIRRDVTNVAYFGSFYPNRGLDDVLVALRNAKAEARSRILLHVFCNRPSETLARAQELGVSDCVRVQGYVPYLDFLALSRRFDILLVNDVLRPQSMPRNPFLPSKLADYKGAGTPVFAIVEEGSPMSRVPVAYRALCGNVPSIVAALETIVKGGRSDTIETRVGL